MEPALNLLKSFLLLLILASASCTPYTVDKKLLTPSNINCKPSDYVGAVEKQSKNLRGGRNRDTVFKALSSVAIDVWSTKPADIGNCKFEIRFDLEKNGSFKQYIYPAVILFDLTNDTVCLNHKDRFEAGSLGDPTETANRHRWKYVNIPQSISGVPDSLLRRKQFVPVCFDEGGNFVRYKDG